MPNFKFLPETPDGPVTAYGQAFVEHGDIITLDGRLAEKARKNPNYEETTESTTPKSTMSTREAKAELVAKKKRSEQKELRSKQVKAYNSRNAKEEI